MFIDDSPYVSSDLSGARICPLQVLHLQPGTTSRKVSLPCPTELPQHPLYLNAAYMWPPEAFLPQHGIRMRVNRASLCHRSGEEALGLHQGVQASRWK